LEKNIVSKHTLLRFIDESKGNINVVLGTKLSVEIAMFALCKVLSKTAFEKKKKICLIFNKNDSNIQGLMKEKISVVIRKLLSNHEFAKKRISLARGEDVIDSSSDITVNSVVEKFYINDKWSEYITALNEAVNLGITQVFILSNSLLFYENMSSIYNMALDNNINIWFQCYKSNESLFFKSRYKDGMKMEKLNIFRSTFNGMEDESKYIVNIDWLSSEFELMLEGVRFWL